ncbi:hypothetical protein PDIDSM_5450 [Penicillium digitatum]|nr:hypothetical protein PDIDSM_5450 [Penicillium digitatum]
MGWLWGSSTKDASKDTPSTIPTVPAKQNAPPKTLTPDEQADLEFNQILADLRAEDASLSKRPGLTADGNPSSDPKHLHPLSLLSPSTKIPCPAAMPSIMPSSVSLSEVNFDHWDNLWLCMKTRTWPEDLRRREIRDHNRKKAIKYKTGPSSEDVWDVRLDPAKDSFKGDFATMWQEMKAEAEAAKHQAEQAAS